VQPDGTALGGAAGDALRRVGIFDRARPETRARLLEAAEALTLPPGGVLHRQGERPAALHLLLVGRLVLEAQADDSVAVIEVCDAPATMVTAAVVRDRPYMSTAVALETAELLALPADVVRGCLAADPDFALALLDEMADRMRGLVAQVQSLKLRTGPQRLAHYLLELAGPEAPPGEVLLPYDKRLVAARLGMTAESLSRAFAALRRYGVTTRGLRVVLADPARLRDFSKPPAEPSFLRD